ncbi:MAG: hypothetical protein RL345_1783, partial [Chloroflexota bacterium]
MAADRPRHQHRIHRQVAGHLPHHRREQHPDQLTLHCPRDVGRPLKRPRVPHPVHRLDADHLQTHPLGPLLGHRHPHRRQVSGHPMRPGQRLRQARLGLLPRQGHLVPRLRPAADCRDHLDRLHHHQALPVSRCARHPCHAMWLDR